MISREKIFSGKKEIYDGFVQEFNILDDGLYLIEVVASAKSWWQNLLKIKFGDDNLALRIDGISFPKLNGKSGFFKGEMSWSGNDLKGLHKTNIFIIYLLKGQHSLSFLSKRNPTLKEINIYKIKDKNQVDFIPTRNNPAEDGNGRQWIAVATINLKVKSLSIKAIAKSYIIGKDHDDLKLIIDSQIQLNEDPNEKKHKYWYWSGKILKGEGKEFYKEIDEAKNLHYFEMWADRMPEIKIINIKIYPDTDTNDNDHKLIPTTENPKWTGNFNDDTEQILLARVLWGEARGTSSKARIAIAWSIKNRIGIRKNWNSYHSVILDRSQYSCFWEKSPNDSNLKALKDPLENFSNYKKWKETYEIAEKIIKEEVPDPTRGATHYYDNSIWKKSTEEIPLWIKEGHVIFRTENLNFLKVN